MTKMEVEIKARQIAMAVYHYPPQDNELGLKMATGIIAQAIAEAVLSEREACAKVAESHIKKEYLIKGKSDSWAQGNNTACYDIADAIRGVKKDSHKNLSDAINKARGYQKPPTLTQGFA